MQTIFKYPLKTHTAEVQTIELWPQTKILSVIEQDMQLFVYAITNPEEAEKGKTKLFNFQVVGTGWDHEANGIDLDGYEYVGTAKVGRFVWHVFCE